MTKTTFATQQDHDEAMRQWFVVDASKHVLGRMAVVIAETLMGKRTPLYTPHVNVGKGVIVVNARRVGVTGAKKQGRVYRRYSGYPGGLKETTLGELREENPVELITLAVRRMLPKSRLGRAMLRRLKVYAGADHPHVAQQPKPLAI